MPRLSQRLEGELGFYRMESDGQRDPNSLTANWVSFSENGISRDLNGTLDSMKIKTAFRIEGASVKFNDFCINNW